MIETDCQQLIVQAVCETGGRALKFNNRFVSGICDLLGKMPGHSPWMLEAKLHNLSAKTLHSTNGHHIADIGCTKLQKDHLRDWHEAGFLTGVVSFIQIPGRETVQTLQMVVYSYEAMLKRHWSAHSIDHRPLGGKSERFTNIRQQLIEFTDG